MLPRSPHLPDFHEPPVVETALSVQFEPLLAIQTVHLGLLWNEYRARFPKTAERPPLDQVIEHFPESAVARVGLKLQAFEIPPVPRIWFTNEQGSEMIQVQNNRFIKNWRRQGDGDQYPHYDETIRPHFDHDFAVFLSFLEKNRLGVPRINQCEVTYVNHIVAGQGWQRYGEVEKIFTFWHSPSFIPPGSVEDLRVNARFVIPGKKGEPVGRLHVDIQPSVRASDDQPMYVLHLTARGQLGEGLDFFDVGREWIVTTFERITTHSMHTIWKMKER